VDWKGVREVWSRSRRRIKRANHRWNNRAEAKGTLTVDRDEEAATSVQVVEVEETTV
jgi:hypothetical protein